MRATLPIRSKVHKGLRKVADAATKKGFALVVSMLLMMLLTVLSIGLLTLSSIELRRGNQEAARVAAQMNARFALEMAIGRLQEKMGPDQRVSARADLVGSGGQGRWVGVWKTTETSAGGELPVVRWNETGTEMLDSRSRGLVTREQLFEGWLVSGDGDLDPAKVSGKRVKLVGQGSVANAVDEVEVPLVDLSNGSSYGAMAYWISDESMKAGVSVVNHKLDEGRDRDVGTGVPEGFGLTKIAGLESIPGPDSEDWRKVSGYSQAVLAAKIGAKDWRRYYHSLGGRATSVLSDSLRGGLKADLSSYFETGVVNPRGDLPEVNATTPLLSGRMRLRHGPKLGVLKAFADLADQKSDGVKVAAATHLVGADKFGAVPQMSHFTSQPVHPVLVQAEIYTRFAWVRGYLTVHFYPRVVLWNPYNVRLEGAEYTVDFNQAINDSLVVEKRGAGGTVDVVSTAWDTRSSKDNRMSFTLEATPLDPGEALVFSARPGINALAGLATPLQLRTGGHNFLSAKVSPNDLSNFYLTLTQLSNLGVTSDDLPLVANHNRGSYYWVDMMDWWEGNPDNGLKISLHLGSADQYVGRMKLPLLQLIDTDNWMRGYEGRYNNGRWRVGGEEPIQDYETTASLEPWTRGCYGIRLKWWVERNPYNYAGTGASRFWNASVLADYNLRAPFAHRSPFDAATDNGEEHHWYMWGPYTIDRQQGLPFRSPERAAHPGPNGYRANPFYGGASTTPDSVYPVYDLPQAGERIVSLGRFQHVQLTPFVWHPSNAIGNSWIPVNLKAKDRSVDSVSPSDASASPWQEQVPYLPAWMKQDRGGDEVVYDLSYEVNHELWDRYFLSGATANEKVAYLEKPSERKLANARLVPAVEPHGDSSLVKNYHEAAMQLMLAGGFNVNSTDEEAWKALLGSIMSGGPESDGMGTNFSRFADPEDEGVDPSDPYDVKAWKGFRKLSDEQLTLLAREVVSEVKKRGPFLSVSDFVNRRLVDKGSPNPDLYRMGTLQEAIERAGLNAGLKGGDVAASTQGHGRGSYEVGSDATDWAPIEHVKDTKAIGMPTYLQQADILQSIGSVLVARGDTFVIRAYGESRDAKGKVEAKAWCEAEVQRVPAYVDESDDPVLSTRLADSGLERSGMSQATLRYGRKFRMVSFRWLSSKEI